MHFCFLLSHERDDLLVFDQKDYEDACCTTKSHLHISFTGQIHDRLSEDEDWLSVGEETVFDQREQRPCTCKKANRR